MSRPPRESRQLDATSRAGLPASFVPLEDGVTCYRLSHRDAQTLVVMVHGYSVGSFVWKPLEAQLNAAGIATLSYDMFGHGWSDRPKGRYDRALFARQLDGLVRTVAPRARILLLAWSMGAMVAASHATGFAQRVAAMMLLSPSGLPIRLGVLGRIAFVPVIGDLGYALIGGATLRAAQSNFFADKTNLPAFLAGYDEQAACIGFKRAMLSTLRHMNMDDFASGYAALGRTGLPVDVLWAVNDRATPFSNHERFQSLVPQARITPLQDVGHASQFEQPALVAGHVIRWHNQG